MRLLPKNWQGRFVLALAAVLVLPYVFSRIASRWRYATVHSATTTADTAPTAQTHLRIGCYNIAHGRGLAESNWAGGSAVERMARLDSIAALLQQNNADILVLNEIDFDCSWSHSINQARYLAEKAGYVYWAEQRNVDFRVLFWKWRFGNAVLSKYPITAAQVIHLPGRSGVESVMGGKKRAILCEIDCPGRSIQVIGAHLCEKSEAVRVSSANTLLNIARMSNVATILAGDLNSTPPDLPESAVDVNGNNAIQTFDDGDDFQRHRPAVPLRQEDLTFHSENPCCIIDWILIPANWMFLTYKSAATELSDHRPVFSDVVWP